VDEQRLVYVDKELHEDQKTLIDYKVQNNGRMYMTMRLKGGKDGCAYKLLIVMSKSFLVNLSFIQPRKFF
jgi:hypothetical protein